MFIKKGEIYMKISEGYCKKIIFFNITRVFYILLVVLFLLSVLIANGAASPKFLIFHLDAVSSRDFFQYMEEGSLPNLKAVFENGNIIHYGLAFFPEVQKLYIPV